MKKKFPIIVILIATIFFFCAGYFFLEKEDKQKNLSLKPSGNEKKMNRTPSGRKTNKKSINNNERTLPDNEQTFLDNYDVSESIQFAPDQTLHLSSSVYAILKDFYTPDLGEKVAEEGQYIEFRSTGIRPDQSHPVVFNQLLQMKGYLTGHVHYTYKTKSDLEVLSDQIKATMSDLAYIDRDTQIITAKYKDMSTLKRLLDIQQKIEIEVTYGQVIPQ